MASLFPRCVTMGLEWMGGRNGGGKEIKWTLEWMAKYADDRRTEEGEEVRVLFV